MYCQLLKHLKWLVSLHLICFLCPFLITKIEFGIKYEAASTCIAALISFHILPPFKFNSQIIDSCNFKCNYYLFYTNNKK